MGTKRAQRSLVRKATRVHELDKKRIVIVDRFLESKDRDTIQKFINNGYHTQMVSRSKRGDQEAAHSSIWMDREKFAKTKLLQKISQQVLAHYNCRVERVSNVYVTQSKFGENSLIHKDGNKGKTATEIGLTAVIFINDKWKEEWGGELTFFDKTKDAVFCVAPKPGRIVISPSDCWHRSGIPSRLFYDYRMSLVVMMVARDAQPSRPESESESGAA